MTPDLSKLFQKTYKKRRYRKQFNVSRFQSFEAKYRKTDLWIGVNPSTFKKCNELLQNFSIEDMVIKSRGVTFTLLKNELVLSVFAGESIISERLSLVIPFGKRKLGIYTSAGTVGPSLSFGKADSFATAFGNKIKSPNDVEKVIPQSEKHPEILSLLYVKIKLEFGEIMK